MKWNHGLENGKWKKEKWNDLNGLTRHKHDGSDGWATESGCEVTAPILWIVARSQLPRSPDELAIG
jgi:hypothetical protein